MSQFLDIVFPQRFTSNCKMFRGPQRLLYSSCISVYFPKFVKFGEECRHHRRRRRKLFALRVPSRLVL